MNDSTSIPQVVPTIYTTLTSGADATDPTIYGANSNTVVFNNTNGIAEIVVNNFDAGTHPFRKNNPFPFPSFLSEPLFSNLVSLSN